jgi:hypothetical protein
MAKEVVSGEIDWNEADLPSPKSGGGKSDYMRLKEGENVVRIMGNPVQTYIHWVTLPDGAQRKIVSPSNSPALVKKLEEAGFRRQPNWIIKVLDRSDNEFKLLEIGNQIYKGIQTLFNNPKWGKVTAYDISVNRGPKGQQPLYSVTPNPKESLESSFKQKYIDFNDRINIDKLVSPMPAEEISKMLGLSSSSSRDENDEAPQTKKAGSKNFDFDFE